LDVHLKLTSIKIALGVLCCLRVLRDSQHSCFQCWKEEYFCHFWWHAYNKKEIFLRKKKKCHGYFDISNEHPFEFNSSTGQRFLFPLMYLWEKKHHGQYGNNRLKE